MKDLTEAQLIEMEKRALKWLNALEEDPDEMSRHEINEQLNEMRADAGQIAQDVADLCEYLRSKVTA
jgi:hypothetical protein